MERLEVLDTETSPVVRTVCGLTHTVCGAALERQFRGADASSPGCPGHHAGRAADHPLSKLVYITNPTPLLPQALTLLAAASLAVQTRHSERGGTNMDDGLGVSRQDTTRQPMAKRERAHSERVLETGGAEVEGAQREGPPAS